MASPKRLEARWIARRALGKKLPRGSEVHHIDKDPSNNSNDNLVLCQDKSYHKFLHQRANAYYACGNPNWRKCSFCGKHDDPKNLYIYKGICYHRKCSTENTRKWRRKFNN